MSFDANAQIHYSKRLTSDALFNNLPAQRDWPRKRVTRGCMSELLHKVQNRALTVLGCDPDQRFKTAASLLNGSVSETASYWLQLSVALGIATLGLVVGSAAVVIGAMLVAPLMTPILGLAMGLATGAPYLAFRALTRVVGSVFYVILLAALITRALPYHELNSELLARTSPTLLDLITAGFCAIAGVYATLRATSDTATTAAGTSIGISLVPPLCTAGYGVGTQNFAVARGAGLLFLTNFVVIVVVGSLLFVCFGFNRLDASQLDSEANRDAKTSFTWRATQRLSAALNSVWGGIMRLIMPLVLLAIVYVPLREALDLVGWQVRARHIIRAEIAKLPHDIVQSQVAIEHQSATINLVIVGDAQAAHLLEQHLSTTLLTKVHTPTKVEVVAVPSAGSLENLHASLRNVNQPTVSATPSLKERLRAPLIATRETLVAIWPQSSAGELLHVAIAPRVPDAGYTFFIVHIGPSLPDAARESLIRSLQTTLDTPLQLTVLTIPTTPLNAKALQPLLPILDSVRSNTEIRACIRKSRTPNSKPSLPPKARAQAPMPAPPETMSLSLDALLHELPALDAETEIQIGKTTCGSPMPTPDPSAPATIAPR